MSSTAAQFKVRLGRRRILYVGGLLIVPASIKHQHLLLSPKKDSLYVVGCPKRQISLVSALPLARLPKPKFPVHAQELSPTAMTRCVLTMTEDRMAEICWLLTSCIYMSADVISIGLLNIQC